MTRKISIIALATSLIALLLEMTALLDSISSKGMSILNMIRSYFSFMSLSFFEFRLLEYQNFETGIGLNYLNVFFYSLLLTGTLVYVFSKYRETRLIRFIFSIILLSNFLFFISAFISPFIYWKYIQNQPYWWVFWIIGRIINVLWVYISYFVIVEINKTKSLDATFKEMDGRPVWIPSNASNWQRLFHFVVDLFICIFILSKFIFLLGPHFLEALESETWRKPALYIFLLLARMIYYPFFEIIFGSTPAKFLSETRVSNSDGQKPKAKTILLRTLSRFIPFEPFSFLNGYGWHDTLTETQLVREKRTGVKGRWYFMVFPFFLLVGLVSYFAHEEYEDYKSRQYSINAHNESIKTLEHELKHITTDHFIEIQDIDHSYSSDKIYLKVEEIETDQLTVAVVQVNNDYSSSLFRIEKIYTKNKNFLSKIPINIDSLKHSYTVDYSEYRRAKRNSRLLYDERRFEIIGIHRLFCPVIRDRGTGSINQNSISISLFNVGWPADIIEIKNLEGNISWENQLPERIESVTSNDYPYFSLNGNNYKRGDTYKFHLIIADSLNRKYTYLVEGKDFKKTVKRIN